MLTAATWDIAPIGGGLYQSPKLTTSQEILDLFDRNVAAASGPHECETNKLRLVLMQNYHDRQTSIYRSLKSHCGFQLSYITVIIVMWSQITHADDWPQWRGPRRDGVWRESGIIESIPESGLKVRWRARVGNGYSGPAVASGRVFVSDHQLQPEVERVLCFDELTGQQIWVHAYPTDYANMEYGNGPRATPTVYDGKVYALGTQGHLTCLDATTGHVIWKRDLVQEFNAKKLTYGFSSAPLVVGELLIVMAGGSPDACIVGLDRLTGEERWRALTDRSSYSAPLVIHAGGHEQLIMWTGDTISSLNPETGKVFWQQPRKASFDEAEIVASPVLHGDRLLCLSAWNRGSVTLSLDRDKPTASVLWKTRSKPSTFIATPLFQDDGHFYASMGDSQLACVDATNGEVVWTTQEPTGKRLGTVHITPHGDRAFLFNQVGNLILAKLAPAGYQELGRCLLVEPTAGFRAQGVVTWAHPAYANKHVFARSDRELISASLAAADQPAAAVATAIKPRLIEETSQWDAPSVLAFAAPGRELVTGSWQGTIELLDVTTGKQLAALGKHKDGICSIAFSTDGTLMVSAGGSEFTPGRNGGKTSGQIKLWNVAQRKEIGELVGHTSKVFSAAFSPNGKSLVTGAADRTVRLWDTSTLKETANLKSHTDAVWSVAFSPDGKTVVSAGADRRVIVWDIASGQPVAELKGHEEEVRAVAFSRDGNTLATGSADWTVRLWDARLHQQQAVFSTHHGGITCVAFSPDGKLLASGSGDQTIKLWNVATRSETETLRDHRSGVTGLAFAPDGRSLVSAGVDDEIRIWEIAPKP